MKCVTAVLAFSGALLASGGAASATLTNGNFETGDLTGWTVYDTPGGTTGGARVVLFDTAGTGSPSNSAQFEVGEYPGGGGGGLGAGGGIQQLITTLSGTLNVQFAMAVSGGNNADSGTFELLLDGNVLSSYAFGGAPAGITRAEMNYTGTVTAGTHLFGIDMRRGYGVSSTPYQYLDNIVLSGPATAPEPTTALLLAFGTGLLAFRRRRVRN